MQNILLMLISKPTKILFTELKVTFIDVLA
jgi:hypothetical protein